MKNGQNRIEVQGTINTTDLANMMNLYTSSFTNSFNEGFIRMLEFQLGRNNFKEVEKPKIIPKKSSKIKPIKSVEINNEGFEKLKNQTLREKLQKCDSVKLNANKHLTIKELGFNSIYELDKRSDKMWKDYFSKNGVYLNEDVTSSKLSTRILFDKSIKDYLKSKGSEPQNGSESISFWSSEKIKRKNIKGGRFGKVKGFNFYIQPNEKLKPCERRKLLRLSEDYISNLIDKKTKGGSSIDKLLIKINHLDSKNTDLELLEEWNLIYDLYGCQIPQLKDSWERDNGLHKMQLIKSDLEFKSIPKPKVLEWINKVPTVNGLG